MIKNEDGRIYEHYGYDVRKCIRCGREFIVAKGYPEAYCRYYDCDRRDTELCK